MKKNLTTNNNIHIISFLILLFVLGGIAGFGISQIFFGNEIDTTAIKYSYEKQGKIKMLNVNQVNYFSEGTFCCFSSVESIERISTFFDWIIYPRN